ncbi:MULTISPECIES: SHOCT domain-containing protein [Rhodococcus]|uniref:SHOCT domain-containing protein n=1 Tax=Rhodococcus TaxID=1827 RepID=UPI000474B057|nr:MULTISPECIES: SHOCT domain-containing protein [Rhodococcus]OWY81555.1 hypothetical protein B9C99_12695 [Rhodococcus sp. BUPNP1]
MDSFWDLLWYTIIVFAFVAYLLVFFLILTDLFRDHTVSGLGKAVWVIALILIPFFSALLYLIVRGQDMAIRAREAQLAARHATDQYIRQAAGRSAVDQIADAKALHESGAITAAEFEQLENRALEQDTPGRGEMPSR